MNTVEEAVAADIAARGLFVKGDRILVACSGGVDSVVLLHLLERLRTSQDWTIGVAHFNHQLRGSASEEDARFVANLCRERGLAHFGGKGEVLKLSGERKISVEMAARELRHEFFARRATEFGSSKIALGHHADDQMELFFLRLFRGSGLDGLTAMHWQNPSAADAGVQLCRPLLNQFKVDLQKFAAEKQIDFREDESNSRLEHERNRVRAELIPFLRSFQPEGLRGILRSIEILREDGGIIAGLESEPGSARDWTSFSIGVQRRIIQSQLRTLNIKVEFGMVEKLRASTAPVMIAPGTCVQRGVGGLIKVAPEVTPRREDAAPEELEVMLQGGGEAKYDGGILRWKLEECGALAPFGRGTEYFDADTVGDSIVLRHWRPGDRFQPIGAVAEAKLQDIFVNLKVAKAERHRRVIGATESGAVFWVEGLRIGERFKLDKTTRRRLKWRWLREGASVAGFPAQ